MTDEQHALGCAYILLNHVLHREELAEDKELIEELNNVRADVEAALTTETMKLIALSYIEHILEND